MEHELSEMLDEVETTLRLLTASVQRIREAYPAEEEDEMDEFERRADRERALLNQRRGSNSDFSGFINDGLG